MMRIVFAMLAIIPLWGDPVNPDSAIIADFQKRVADYVQLRKSEESKLKKLRPTGSTEEIARHQHQLREAMTKARANARQGDFFTPAIDREFRRLMGFALQGDATRIRKSLRDAEPVAGQPGINHPYPDPGIVPLQSTPPSILLNLPRLPADIEYRFVSRTLILLDTRANLILDYMTNIGP
jgi:hypothetical protein